MTDLTQVIGSLGNCFKQLMTTNLNPKGESLLKDIEETAKHSTAEADQEKRVLMPLHLCSFALSGEPCAVDVKNGRIVRIMPLHFDWKYKPDEIRLPTFQINGKILKRPHLKALASYHALASKKRVYSPNRIRYPLKRVDFDIKDPPNKRNQQNRGVSGFIRISWDEALDIIKSEVERIKKTSGLRSILVFSDGHGQSGVLHTIHGYGHGLFLLLGGATHAIRNPDSWEGWYYGARHTWGFPGPHGLPPYDYVMEDVLRNAEVIVTSCNTEATGSGMIGMFTTIFWLWVRELGKRVIFITPEYNYTAAAHLYWVKGGKWIPIRPNTDAALYLSIAYVWITEGIYDKEYVRTHTYGFDEFKKYVLGEEDGVPKTPKWAEEITGVPARIIKALARLWASKRTSYVNNFGGGKIRGPYASEPARLEAILLAMQGLGKPGVQELACIGQAAWPGPKSLSMDPDTAELIKWVFHPLAIPHGDPRMFQERMMRFNIKANPLAIPKTVAADAVVNPPISWYSSASFEAPRSDQFVKYSFPPENEPNLEIHMIWNENTCLTTCWNPGNKFVEVFRNPKIEFHVGMGVWLEDDLLFADLILPNCTVFEVTDLGHDPASSIYYCEQAIGRIGESKSLYETYCAIAERFGLLKEFTRGKSDEEWLKTFFEEHLVSRYMSWEEFKKKKYFVMPYPKPEEWEKIKRERNIKPFMTKYWELPEGKGMGWPDPTPTGKIEFFSTDIAKHMPWDKERPPVPRWIPEGESYKESLLCERAKKYPLLLLSNHGRWRYHAQCDDITWFREIPTCKVKGPDGYLYEPVWIHPKDAEKRGIRQGDVVKVFNERGAILCGAYITERIQPGVVSIDHGSRLDPIAYDKRGGILIDRGGASNLLVPGPSKSYPLMCVTGILVEVEKVNLIELALEYPDAFRRKLHRDVGPCLETWVRGVKE